MNAKLITLTCLSWILNQSIICASPYASGSFTVKSGDARAVFLNLGKGKESKKEFVLKLMNGEVYGHGLVMDDNRMILADTVNQWPGHTIDDLPLRKRNNFQVEKVNLSIAVIGNSGQDNYYHWLFQILPRLHLLSLAKIKCDKYYFESQLSLPFQHETLRILGVSEENLIFAKDDTIIKAKELLIPSISTIPAKHGEFAFKGWCIPWLKSILLEDYKVTPHKFLYISRVGAKFRRITNEEELINSLKDKGFEIIKLEELSVKEQAKLFNAAKLIVAQHGAGLANLAFAQKEVTVIEIDNASPYIFLTKVIGGVHFGFKKIQIIETKENTERLLSLGIPKNKIRDCCDIEIDIKELMRMISQIVKT